MNFIVDRFKFLGLNDREVKVFTALATFGRMNMTKIASRAGLPRTTVDAIVRRLQEQGLVTREKVRGHLEYEVKPQEVADTLGWIEQRFRATHTEETLKDEKNINDEKIVTEPKYIGNLEDIAKMYKGDRVRLLFSRGFEDMDVCVTRFKEYVEVALVYGYKMEVMLSASIAHALKERVWHIPKTNFNHIYLNIVPTSYSTALFDMFVFRDCIVLVHTASKGVERVEAQSVVASSKHLIEIASETGWCIDLSAWLNGEHS